MGIQSLTSFAFKGRSSTIFICCATTTSRQPTADWMRRTTKLRLKCVLSTYWCRRRERMETQSESEQRRKMQRSDECSQGEAYLVHHRHHDARAAVGENGRQRRHICHGGRLLWRLWPAAGRQMKRALLVSAFSFTDERRASRLGLRRRCLVVRREKGARHRGRISKR